MPLVTYLEERGNRIWLGVLAVVVTVVAILADINGEVPPFPLVFHPLPGIAFLAAGLLLWGRHHISVFLLLVGFTWFIGSLLGLHVPLLVGLSLWFQDLWRVVLAHTALAYPAGELRPGLPRALVVFGYGFIVAGGFIRTLADNAHEYFTCECPRNALGFIHNKAFFETVDNVYGIIGALIELVLIVLLVRLYLQARREERSRSTPLLVTAGAFGILLVVEVMTRMVEVSPPVFDWLFFLVHLGLVAAAASYALALRRVAPVASTSEAEAGDRTPAV